jgi:hypothetical protein
LVIIPDLSCRLLPSGGDPAVPPVHVGNSHSITTKVAVCDVETITLTAVFPDEPTVTYCTECDTQDDSFVMEGEAIGHTPA